MIKKRATTAVTRNDLKGKNLESYKVIEAEERLENKIKPRLDYSDPANFATYGSAEEYYVASVDNIQDMYPYDGSKFEKTEWHVSGSGLDNYLFDNRYPRRNGHIAISHDGWGTPSLTTGSYSLPDTVEYITLLGGPHTDASAQSLSSLFPSDGGTANVWSPTEDREANLTIGTSNTIEWWMKKDAFESPGQQEVVFDLWDSGSTYSESLQSEMLFEGPPESSSPWGIAIDEASGKIYWTDTAGSDIYKSNLDGTSVEAVFTGIDSNGGLALDIDGGRIFYTGGNTVKVANMDGTGIPYDLGDGTGDPYDVSLDIPNEKVYAISEGEEKIYTLTMNGGAFQTPTDLYDLSAFDDCYSLTLDLENRLIYFIDDNGATGGIYQISMDSPTPGSATAVHTWSVVNSPRGIKYNSTDGRLYWADYTRGIIASVKTDGTDEKTLVSGEVPWYLAVRNSGDIFWTRNNGDGEVHRSRNLSTYGRLAVLINSSSAPLHLTYLSSSVFGINAGFGGAGAPTTSSICDGSWHHYAISVDAANGKADLYVDGKHSDSITGSPLGEVPGALVANIGSYYEPRAADDLAVSFTGSLVPGWCKLSASLDEFRFWKTARTAEEIGLNWNTQVYGGTNTDTANTDLGVYYKFNEGIMGTSQDATVLDYSGRISNGTWTGYTSGARSLTSAMVESGASTEEFKDPIIYATNPDVLSLREELRVEGLVYDQQNNASLYNSIPSYMREEDSGQQNILKLTQIMSSYLDSLQASIGEVNKIKNLSYPSGSESEYHFSRKNVQNLGFDTEEFFIDATVLERFMHKNDSGDLEYKLSEIKNLIYQNIYNNLSFIMASKGTEKSFRNLARCFGIDEKLLKLKIYSNNEEYTLEDKYANAVVKKNMVDFSDPTRFEATMFQTSSAEAPTRSWVSSSADFAQQHGMTLEADVTFLKKPSTKSSHYFDTPFLSSSLFGAKGAETDDLTWLATDNGDLQVYAVREERNGDSAYFQLTSSALGINLTSSVFGDVHVGERWNLAAKVKNSSLNVAGDYTIEFQGVNSDGDRIDNSFLITASLGDAEAQAFLASGKRVYAGAYRTNFTGSVITKTDALVSSVRYWAKHLSEGAITNHAKDATSYGIKDANRPLFSSGNDMPAIDTLLLDWEFNMASDSDAAGEFTILDFSSGSADKGEFGYFHAGKGYDFPVSTRVINREYVSTLPRVNPENAAGADMVKVLTQAEEIKEELSNPTNLVFSVEKSLYQEISDEMLKFFSTSADLASLFMKPTDKYNTANQELALIRQKFFEKMQNSPDVNKFYEYFKWIDDAVVTMLRQQLPAAAEIVDGSINIIESHILERNKITHKAPTYATSKSPVYEGSMRTPYNERLK
jgi:hypothetical protein